ncbi:MAG: radical SAM protein [Chloroflexota bacterium]|nr:radical SAM protein [Chloroflexota bacterium]
MRHPGAVLLVSCYELGHQPVNLASPLAVLRRAGYQPAAVDTSVEELSDEAIRRARLVAISVPMHTALRLGEPIARRVRQVNPAAHLCLYGLYAWLNGDYLLGRASVGAGFKPAHVDGGNSSLPRAWAGLQPVPTSAADSVIGGEFEGPLLGLAQWLERGDGSQAHLLPEGVFFRDRPALPHLRLPDYPVPDREGLPPLERYAGFWRNGSVAPAGYVEATRGCKHTCAHCPITPVYGGRFFAVPRQIVLEDVRRQVWAGARHITFGDPDFLNGPTHALRIAREMHRELPELTFDATIKVEHILKHRELFPELKELGCAFVVSAVESLSDVVLARLRKGHTKADVAEAFEVTAAAGIPLRASLVAFTPWTTMDDYLELLDFVESHGLVGNIDPVHYGIRLLVPPKSALLDEPDAAGWLGELDPEAYGYRWEHPDARMDRLHEEVCRVIAGGAAARQDALATFAAVKQAALAAAGRASPAGPERIVQEVSPPPRLTESWFC